MIFLFCLMLLILSPLAHIILCSLHSCGRLKTSILLITFLCLPGGLTLPVLASCIDVANLPQGVKCGTPALRFAYIGSFLTILVIPASAVIFDVIAYYQRKRPN